MTAIALYSDIGGHLLEDMRPSEYLSEMFHASSFGDYPFSMLGALEKTEQSPVHHPEGNVWMHTLLVVDEAARLKSRSRNQAALMWAALLHDIGKPSVTKVRKGKITAYDHDKAGAALSKEFLRVFEADEAFINEVSQLIRYHMQILFVVKDLPFKDIKGMKQHTDIKEVALLGLCDRLGRGGNDRAREEQTVALFLQKCGEKW